MEYIAIKVDRKPIIISKIMANKVCHFHAYIAKWAYICYNANYRAQKYFYMKNTQREDLPHVLHLIYK